MDLINEIGKKTSHVCYVTVDKTSKIAKEAKQKMKMAGYKSQIEDLYEEIGKKVYENHIREEKQNIYELTLEECIEIDKLASQIEEIRKKNLSFTREKTMSTLLFRNSIFLPFLSKLWDITTGRNRK